MLADWIHIDQMHADADVCPGSTYTGRRIYMQEGEARREQLLQMLRDSTAPISGSALARSLDVIIEHEIYGQITANLILENRRDVAEFCDRLKHFNAKPLNIIAGGTHYHTVEARSEVMLDNIECALREKGYLVRA